MAVAQNLELTLDMVVKNQGDIANLIKQVGSLEREMKKLQASSTGLSQATEGVIKSGKRYSNVIDSQSQSLRQNRQGSQMAMMQLNDFTTSVATGASPVMAFNQQIGQLGYSMNLMTGKAKIVGAFLSGPWGLAIIVATAVLGPMIEALFKVEKEQKKVEIASHELANAESILGEYFDLTTGKIREQNPVLIANTRLKLAAAKADAMVAQEEGRNELTAIRRGGVALQGDFGGGLRVVRTGDRTQEIVERFRTGVNTVGQSLDQLRNQFESKVINYEEWDRASKSINKVAMAGENLKTYTKAEEAFNGSARALQGFLKPAKAAKTVTDKLAAQRDREATQVEALAEKIRDYGLQYNSATKEVGATAKKLDDFNDLVEKLGTLKGGTAVVAALADTIAGVRRAIVDEGANKALEDFNAEIDKIMQKDLSPFQQAISGLMEKLGNPELEMTPDTTAKYYEAVNTASNKFFKDAINGAQDLLDKTNGVDNAYNNQLNTMRQMILEQRAMGIETGLLEEGYARFVQLSEDNKIAERNAEIRKSFEDIGMAVSSAFRNMLEGASSWKDGMKSIIMAVIDQLWQLYVVQQIVGFVTKSLGGLGMGGGGGPTDLLSNTPYAGRAAGGSVSANTPYMVGERGPEMFMPNASGTIIPRHNLNGGGGGGAVINVDARGSADPAAVRQQVYEGIRQAAPAIIAASEARTIKTLRRPRLGGGSI